MGIRGLVSLLNEIAGADAAIQSSFADLPPGTKICIDASGCIYSSLMKNAENHVSGCLNLVEKMCKYGILPVFVFDGTPPKEKKTVLDERRKYREKARQKMQSFTNSVRTLEKIMHHKDSNLGAGYVDYSNVQPTYYFKLPSSGGSDPPLETEPYEYTYSPGDEFTMTDLGTHIEQINTLTDCMERERKKAVGLNERQINEIKDFLNAIGIPYIHLDMEADIICAKLVSYGIVDYCIGNDMDLLAYGCTKIIRNIQFRDDKFTICNYNKILSVLDLTHEQFIDLCIIIGCDYTQRVFGLKPLLGYQLIHKYHTIESIIANLELINKELDNEIPGRFIKLPTTFNYEHARYMFNGGITLISTDMLVKELCDVDFNNIYITCKLLQENKKIYNNVFTLCKKLCYGLNSILINRKLTSICYGILAYPNQEL